MIGKMESEKHIRKIWGCVDEKIGRNIEMHSLSTGPN